MSQPCGMWPSSHGVGCGKPATVGWPSDSGGVVPICDACIAWTGTPRKYLKKIPDFTTATTTPEVKGEA